MTTNDISLGRMIASSPTTSSSTGWRAYEGSKKNRKLLVMEYKGTPANKSRTIILRPSEARAKFEWDIENDRNFAAIAEWLDDIFLAE